MKLGIKLYFFWSVCLGQLCAKELFKPLDLSIKAPIVLKSLQWIPLNVQYHGFASINGDKVCYVFCVENKTWVYLEKYQRTPEGFQLKRVNVDNKTVVVEMDDGRSYSLELGQTAYKTDCFRGVFYDKISQKSYEFSEKMLTFQIDSRQILLKPDPDKWGQIYFLETKEDQATCAYCLQLESENL